MAFVQEGLTPLDQFVVDLADDLRAERLVAPVRESDPAAQRRLIALREHAYPLIDIAKEEDGGKNLGERFDKLLMRSMLPLPIQRFFNRRTEAFGQARAENLAVRDLARSDCHVLVTYQRYERGIQIPGRILPERR